MDQKLISYLDNRLNRHSEELRRHFDVVAEEMKTHIQIVAEGVSSLSERLDRVGQNLREEILCSQRELSAMIKFSYA